MTNYSTIVDSSEIMLFDNLRFYYRKGTPDEEILSKRYQQPRFYLPEYIIKDDDVVLDIGAHIGIFSILTAAKLKKGKVYAIEPNSENFSYLNKNIELNNFSNITSFLMALSNYKGNIKLFYGKSNWGHSLFGKPDERGEIVATDTLANFIKNNNLSVINYMKMNVEGAEYLILLNTEKNIMRVIKLMLVEFHPSDKFNENILISYFNKCGFKTEINYSNKKGKGWITAKLK